MFGRWLGRGRGDGARAEDASAGVPGRGRGRGPAWARGRQGAEEDGGSRSSGGSRRAARREARREMKSSLAGSDTMSLKAAKKMAKLQRRYPGMSGGADGVRFTPPTPSEQHAADGPPQPQPIPEGGAEEDEEDDDEDDEVEPLGEERLGEEDDFVAGDPCDVCEGVHAAQGEHDLPEDEALLLTRECQVIQQELADAAARDDAPTPQAMSEELEREVVGVLETYTDKGGMAADNVLDKVVEGWQRDHSALPLPRGLAATRQILHAELDPGAAPWPHETVPVSFAADSLEQVLCCYAWYVTLRPRFAVHAKQLAQLMMDPASTLHLLPMAWVGGVECAARTPVDVAASCIAKPPPKAPSAKDKWKQVQAKDPQAPAVMAEVLGMVGLEDVKEEMIKQYYRIRLAQDQGDGAASSYNVRFEGNPGTGKSTVARHYNAFLQQLGVLPEGCMFLETSGGSLLYKGVKFLQEELDKVKSAGGGVVFVDEAHQLMADRQGQMVLDFIVPIAEKLNSEYGPMVWIFAGYSKQMQKLFEHDPGLPSRFPMHFTFKDYTDDELLSIFNSLLTTQTGGGAGGKPEIVKSSVRNPVPARPTPPSKRHPVKIGDTATDAWGNKWTFNGNSWYDTLGNTTGYGANGLGAPNNPLVGKSGQWTYSDGLWTSDKGAVQGHYPGSPEPVVPKAATTAARSTKFVCEQDKHARIAMRRLGRRRGQVGFGNARAVRVYFDQVRARQAQRVTLQRAQGADPDIFVLTQEDLLGHNHTEVQLRSSEAYKALAAMEGLAPVKESVDQLVKHVVHNAEREMQEKPVLGVALNRVFLGNPGTGKTTVAKLYAQLLSEMNLLSKGDVVVKSPSDFIGNVTGESEKLTRDILRAAEGCVLVIDEAYSLYGGGEVGGQNDPFKTAVIDTLVEQVQSVPGDDRAVVMLGYQEEMERMMKNVNPGLSRRFQLEYAFQFPDYDDTALTRILTAKARKDGLQIDLATAKRAVGTLARARAKPHFGNAGAVDNLLSAAKLRMQQRATGGVDAGKLTLADFAADQEGPDNSILDTLLDDLIGSESVKSKLESLRDTVLFAQARGEDPKSYLSYNYLFLGNPGTGKTTIARRMGTMFKALGLLPDDTVEEISASDLSTGFSGQSGKKTREIMRKARGGVLFIDEAYQLDPARGGTYMTEAVDEMVKCLTAEEFKGKLLVILAGYEKDMEGMLATNPGLKSRFAERVQFDDLDANAAADLLAKMMERKLKLPVSPEDRHQLPAMAERLVHSQGFGNGRDVDTWCQMSYQEVAKRSKGQGKAGVTLADMDTALSKLLESRQVSASSISCAAPANRPGEQTASQSASAVKVAVKTAEAVAEAEEEAPPPPPPEPENENFNPFDAVDKRVLQKMQDFIEENGLNSEDGVNGLAGMDKSDPQFKAMVAKMVAELGMSGDEATDQLIKWQIAQEDLQAELDKIKQNQDQMTKQPIWRCGVCGRANKPWIVCYVAPYIAYYEPIKPKE